MSYFRRHHHEPAGEARRKALRLLTRRHSSARIRTSPFLGHIQVQLLGHIQVQREHLSQAASAFVRAIEIDPTFAGAYARLAHLCGRRRTDLNRALELAQQVVAPRPDSAAYPNTLSWVYCLRGDYVNAARAVERAPEVDPDEMSIWLDSERSKSASPPESRQHLGWSQTSQANRRVL